MADLRQAGSLWTPEEDVVLLRHVAKYGTKHWGYLQTAGILPHRDQKACCNRFILLKRKFFQARAKGQRLTFPVVPQPEPSSLKRSSPPPTSSDRSLLSSRPLQTGPSVSSKRSGSPISANANKLMKMGSDAHSLSAFSELDNFSAGYSPEQTLILQKTMESLPEKPFSHHDSSALAPLPTSVVKSEVLDFVPRQQPMQKQQPLQNIQNIHYSPQSAVWKCFNPVDVSALLSEVTDQTHPGVSDVTESSTKGGCMAPDAMLEQMAASPMKALFGGNNNNMASAAENFLEAYSQGEAANWTQPSNVGFDLWDLMRASAMV